MPATFGAGWDLAGRVDATTGPFSGIQRLPSQNMSWALLSATRLATRAPWLCGPASRRVCYFEEAGRMPAVSHRRCRTLASLWLADPSANRVMGTARAVRRT